MNCLALTFLNISDGLSSKKEGENQSSWVPQCKRTLVTVLLIPLLLFLHTAGASAHEPPRSTFGSFTMVINRSARKQTRLLCHSPGLSYRLMANKSSCSILSCTRPDTAFALNVRSCKEARWARRVGRYSVTCMWELGRREPSEWAEPLQATVEISTISPGK